MIPVKKLWGRHFDNSKFARDEGYNAHYTNELLLNIIERLDQLNDNLIKVLGKDEEEF